MGKAKKKVNTPTTLISEDEDGSLITETFQEWKRQNPSPEEKRYDTGEKDYDHIRTVVSKDKKTKESIFHSRRGNTQISKTRINIDRSSGNEIAKSSWKSNIKQVERGKKYKDKFGNYQSPVHYMTGVQESKSKRKMTIRKKA